MKTNETVPITIMQDAEKAILMMMEMTQRLDDKNRVTQLFKRVDAVFILYMLPFLNKRLNVNGLIKIVPYVAFIEPDI